VNCLVVIAHPLESSLCRYLSSEAISHLKSKNYQVNVKDLYQEGFSPVLTPAERESYYQKQFDINQLKTDIEQLQNAEILVLIFPTWWFGFPAILKGWFDRVWAPGYAYDHASDLGAISPKLSNLKEVKVITTLGSPWWVDNLLLWQPVKRILRIALLGSCSRGIKFKMVSLYNSEKVPKAKLEKFIAKIKSIL